MADAAALFNAPDDETLELLRDSARDFCNRRLNVDRVRGLRGSAPPFERQAWVEMCELGWSGIVIPESAGGLGFGALVTKSGSPSRSTSIQRALPSPPDLVLPLVQIGSVEKIGAERVSSAHDTAEIKASAATDI